MGRIDRREVFFFFVFFFSFDSIGRLNVEKNQFKDKIKKKIAWEKKCFSKKKNVLMDFFYLKKRRMLKSRIFIFIEIYVYLYSQKDNKLICFHYDSFINSNSCFIRIHEGEIILIYYFPSSMYFANNLNIYLFAFYI